MYSYWFSSKYTTSGSSTEVFVYNPEFDINWPNQQLGVLKTQDKNFSLPGDIGAGNLDSLTVPAPGASSSLPDILATPTLKERQVHALYNANDYIRYTQVACDKDILDQRGDKYFFDRDLRWTR